MNKTKIKTAIITLTLILGCGLLSTNVASAYYGATVYVSSIRSSQALATKDALSMQYYSGWGTSVKALRLFDTDSNIGVSYCLYADSLTKLNLAGIINDDEIFEVVSVAQLAANPANDCGGVGAAVVNYTKKPLVTHAAEDLRVGDIVRYSDIISMETYPGIGDRILGLSLMYFQNWGLGQTGTSDTIRPIASLTDWVYRVNWAAETPYFPETPNTGKWFYLGLKYVSFMSQWPESQTVTKGENATFTSSIADDYTGKNFTYRWYAQTPRLGVDNIYIESDDNLVDNGDGSWTLLGNDSWNALEISIGEGLSLGDTISFKYTLNATAGPECESGNDVAGGFRYSLETASGSAISDTVCGKKEEVIEYVLTEDDLSSDWGDGYADPNQHVIVFISSDYLAKGDSLVISDIKPIVTTLYSDAEIPGETSSNLVITPSSPYYKTGMGFSLKVTSANYNNYELALSIATLQVDPLVEDLTLELSGITSAVVGHTISATAKASVDGVLTDVTNIATFASRDVATNTPDEINGNQITFTHASDHEICVSYGDKTDCGIVKVSAGAPNTGFLALLLNKEGGMGIKSSAIILSVVALASVLCFVTYKRSRKIAVNLRKRRK